VKPETHPPETRQEGPENASLGERIRNALVVVTGAALMIGLSVATMAFVASPDGWVMQSANQALLDQQQAVATKFAMNLGR